MLATVTANTVLAPGFFYLDCAPQTPMKEITAGSFVMIRCADSIDPYLRRPMSIADYAADGSRFGLVIQTVGKGTTLLELAKPGDQLDFVGPFGKGFIRGGDPGYNTIWLVAGGTGVAPFLGLVESLPMAQRTGVMLFIGARTNEALFFQEGFRSAGVTVFEVTEDGSCGVKGLVTAPVIEKLATGERPDIILTCGPSRMMRAVADLAGSHNIPCRVSLENRMACGFGACLGCVTKRADRDSYVAVCKSGPVFDATTIEF
jgi:dihydroorotate dehydrogenase electron transfer subunit